MSRHATLAELDREQAAFAAAADRALVATQEQAATLQRQLRETEAELEAARAVTDAVRRELEVAHAQTQAARGEVDALHRAGHIPAAKGHPLSRFFMRVGRRLKTAGL